ncbi:MAG: CCA tRNA nucleotidyltransferase [Methanomassiliicoccales archaeon]|nr:MAG: CCA tRNA nucleotidyltransferase [Methanomassiliicoccales archaeon]
MEIIRPNDRSKKEVKDKSQDLLKKVKALASKYDCIEDVRLVGSVAKDTYVGRPDIDVFILFSPSTKREVMEETGLLIGDALLTDKEKRYAEHPYVHGHFDGFEVDIVPCYMISDTKMMMSAVDRTPFHTDYIISNLKDEQKSEVILLKQFLKGIDAYGAEAKTQGFSGYLVELLVIKYGTFKGVLEAASTWKTGERLDINGKGGKRFQSPLTFYDPVDLSRNVASALSLEKFCLFVHACKEYRASPDMRYFFPNKRMNLSCDEIRKREDAIGHPIVFASCKRPDIVDDNLYPQARKTLDGLVTQLEKDDFCILDKALNITEDEVVFGLLLETDVLSPTYKHIGPPVTMANSKTFLARWKGEAKVGPYIENGRWVAIVKRDVKNADVALIKALTTASLGDSFKDCDIKVFNTKQHLRDGHLECATKLLDKRMSWEI